MYYLVCGKGSLERHLRTMIDELGLGNRVKLLGFRTDIAEICKAVDVYVHPSFREGLPVALMEAMDTGLPVICSKIRGNSDLVKDDEGGYLVNPNDIDGFHKAITRVIEDRSRLDGHLNMETARNYSIDTVLRLLR